MIELRPKLVSGEAPLVFTPRPRPVLDASVRPLLRGAALAVILAASFGLPAFRPLATAAIPTLGGPAAIGATGAAAPRKDATRLAGLREALR